MKKLAWIVIVLAVVATAYYFLVPQANAPAVQNTTTAPSSTTHATKSAVQKPDVQTTGAAGVSNSNAPAGSATECAKCDTYAGAQKAQCLVALNCQ